MINTVNNSNFINRLLLVSVLCILFILTYKILVFFITPVLWAAIIAYATWPIYSKVLEKAKQKNTLAAFIMMLGVLLIVFIPLIITIFYFQVEARSVYQHLQQQLDSGQFTLPTLLTRNPIFGSSIQEFVDQLNDDPSQSMDLIRQWLQSHLALGKEVFNQVSKNIVKLLTALLTLFFMYRDGHRLYEEIRKAVLIIVGHTTDNYITAIAQTTKAVVYGIGFTALAQAVCAGVGYAIAGAPSPVLLTLLTFILALIPFGTPFVWAGVCVWLFSHGMTTQAIGLAAWGILVVSWIDNVIRPIVISGATEIPFIVIMFGVLGGLAAFGFVGIFVGPVILAVLVAVWREWLQTHHTADDATAAADIDNQPIEQPKSST